MQILSLYENTNSLQGVGVEKSVETAVMYWKQAAEQGYQPAIQILNDY